MGKNVGKVDRYLRLGLGAFLIAFWFFDPTRIVWLAGLVPMITGFINFCPVYRFFGVSTCPIPPGLPNSIKAMNSNCLK